MVLRNRRNFLKLCAASVPALAVGDRLGAEALQMTGVFRPIYQTSPTVNRYIDPLPIPKRLTPQSTHKDKVQYSVRMSEFTHQMHSQLPPTRVWGYEGQYPGPTFDVMSGVPVEVRWENALPEKHIFQVDPHIHGAMPPTPAVRTVPHLHGARTRSESDGLPEKWFTPGKTERYHYPNEQQAATLWYHDHALGITRLNVYAGLSGFYLLRDAHELSMNLPSGDYEIPLLIQDRILDDKGQLVYAPTWEEGTAVPPGAWGPEFFGDLPVVNGAIYPYLDVEPCRYRFRVLNGSNARFYNLYLNLAPRPTDVPSLVPFHQIGTDGGFLGKPAPLHNLLLGSAERADLIIDFSGLEGKVVTLSNSAGAPFPGWDQVTIIHPLMEELMKFRVRIPLSSKAKSFQMPANMPLPKLDPKASVANRDFVLSELMDKQGKSLGLRINGKGYDDPIVESPKLGSIETWRFINTTDDAHPMHLHLVQFQVLHRQGFRLGNFLLEGKMDLVGAPRPPADHEAGWKDTAVVNPNELLTIIVRFDGFAGRYVYHCHMLEHEDNDMMRPYEVVSDKS
jgi:spore coat protein A